MPTQKRPPDDPTPPSSNIEGAPPELIVITRDDAELRSTPTHLFSRSGANTTSLESLLRSSEIRMIPVFGNEERVSRTMESASSEARETVPKLSTFYKIEADESRLEEIAEKLLNERLVDGAYIMPRVYPPVVIEEPRPAAEEAPPISPDFSLRQIYLNAAPAGIDARYAWTVPGGKGQGVRIIDIEGAWRFSHEDLLQNQGGVIGGVQSADIGWRNHGTAVTGEFGGDENAFGITGICPQANVRAISIFGAGQSTAKAIIDAANALSPGDIILIELHAPGPRYNFQDVGGQRGFIAMEFWPANFAAILYATSVRGVIVVEAAGNGAENFDDPLYNARPAGFPSHWSNPFNLANPQSGAIIVGAGAPPPGTHGQNHGPDRSRLNFSNYGARVDAQGWGREVTTVGYGDLQGGSNEDLWYTDQFSGTSSASPIVVGAIACAQGARRAAGQTLLTPATARNLLRATGSPQQASPGMPVSQRIGNRPNLRQMIGQISPVTTVPLYRYWNPGGGDHFYTTDWAELGSGRYGWGYEGIQCHVLPTQRAQSVPLYRYWNPGNADHFYTTNWAELGSGRYGWGYEGIQCYVYPIQVAGTVPLYRYWNGSIGDHFYTTNWAELGSGRYGWGYEGIQCYVFPQPASPPSADDAPFTRDEQSHAHSDDHPPDAGEGLSPIASTFVMGDTASGKEVGNGRRPLDSFSTPEQQDQRAPRGSSFDTGDASASPRRGSGSPHGQVIINVNMNGGADDAA